MIDSSTTDDIMRQNVVAALKDMVHVCMDGAARDERIAGKWSREQARDLLETANLCRRQAAHYQQAIDLLTAAPMPEE